MSTSTKKKKKKLGLKILIFLALAVVVIIVASAVKNAGKVQAEIPTVQTARVTRGDLQEEVSSAGTVAGEETITIYAPASGTVKEISVRSGDEISAGAVLMTYDLEKLEADLYQAKLQNEKSQLAYDNTLTNNSKGNGKVSEAKVNLSVLEKQIEDHEAYLKNLQTALSDYLTKESNDRVLKDYNLRKKQTELAEKLKSLPPGTTDYNDAAKELESVANQLEQLALQQSLTTKSEYQADLEKKISEEKEAIAGFQEYRAKMEAQKSTGEASVLDDYNRRQLEIDKELTDLNYQRLLDEVQAARKGISTEVQGVVTTLSAAPGGSVAVGMPVATLERTDKLKVSASATKYVMERLKVGQQVEVRIGDKTYDGRVSHIDRFATISNLNAASVGFEVELLQKDDFIYLGMEAKMTIFTRKAENALQLPTQAVNANKDGDFVYVVQNGAIVKKPVKVGIISNGITEIIEGVTESDEVVVKSQGNLEEGMEVLATPAN